MKFRPCYLVCGYDWGMLWEKSVLNIGWKGFHNTWFVLTRLCHSPLLKQQLVIKAQFERFQCSSKKNYLPVIYCHPYLSERNLLKSISLWFQGRQGRWGTDFTSYLTTLDKPLCFFPSIYHLYAGTLPRTKTRSFI